MIYLYCALIWLLPIPIIAVVKHKYFRDVFASTNSYGYKYNDEVDNILLSILWPIGILILILFVFIGIPLAKLIDFMEKHDQI